MRRMLRENGLSTVIVGLFFVFLLLQSVTGWRAANQQNQEHQQPPESYLGYVASGSFVEATFEHWESEFLQMAGFVLLTVFLRQRGSPESKPVAAAHTETGSA